MRIGALKRYCIAGHFGDSIMPAIILWLLGVPVSVILLLYLFGVLG